MILIIVYQTTMSNQSKAKDYSQGKIYKWYSKLIDKSNYGSTADTLDCRERNTRYACKSYFNGTRKDACASFEIVSQPDAKMTLVEDFPCNSRKELERREGWYQLNNDCNNINIAGRTRQEYNNDPVNKAKAKSIVNTPEGKARKLINDKKYRDNPERQTPEGKEKKSISNKKYRDNPERQTPEYKEKQSIASKKYYEKKKIKKFVEDMLYDIIDSIE